MLLFLGFWFILLFSGLSFILSFNNETAVFELLLTLFLLVACGVYLALHQNIIITFFLLLNVIGLLRQFRFIKGLIKQAMMDKRTSPVLDKPQPLDFPLKIKN